MSETASADKPEGEAKKGGAAHEFFEIVKTVVYALLIALFLRVVFFQPFTIPSASMEPNLYQGDYIIISKYSYGWSRYSIPFSPPLFKGRIFAHQPHRGDIVVFKFPSDTHMDYVKRMIGLPGDRIQMKDGLLYVNGQMVARQPAGTVKALVPPGFTADVQQYRETLDGKSYLTQDFGPDAEYDNTDVYVVPEGYYFVMGDNRDNSSDSRVPPARGGVGYVPAENLEGKAQIILISWDEHASIFKPWTWILNLRPSRFFHVLH
jgi:signal peptidase I